MARLAAATKSTAFPTGADAFGLPLNEMRAGRAHFDCLQYEGPIMAGIDEFRQRRQTTCVAVVSGWQPH
jgi:hypothetical protein